jgi:endonuclease/exonuclease/phosphatase family metal-dependent hydrolase
VTLRVMTWNLWWRFGDWEARLRAIEAVVRAEQPDILCLQEVWSADGTSSAEQLAAALGMTCALTDDAFPEHRAESGMPGFHNAVLARWPLEDVWSEPLPRRDGAPGHRRALVAAVPTPFGRWSVISTHTDHRFDDSETRQRQCEALLHLVAGVRGAPDEAPPVIVAGDFNAVADSDEIRLLTGRRASPVRNLVLSDCWEHVGEGDGATWRADNPHQTSSAWPNRRLDYVFVSWPRPKPIGNPRRAWLAGIQPIDGVHPSDHAAVVVELTTADD